MIWPLPKSLGSSQRFTSTAILWDIKMISVHAEVLLGETRFVAAIWWRHSSFKGALKVHVDTENSWQQLPLVLIETLKDILDWRAAPANPGGEQAGRAGTGRERSIVVQLQLAEQSNGSIYKYKEAWVKITLWLIHLLLKG